MDLHVGSYLSLISKCINYTFRSKPPVPTIDTLPDELLLHIFQFLEVEGVLQCEQVCRRWRKLATDSALWRRTQVVCSGQRGKVCPKTIGIIKSHSQIVRHLKMQYILKYPFLSSLTGMCSNLQSLEIIMCRIQVEIEEDLKQWPYLKKLNLKNSMLKSNRPLLLPLDYFRHLNFLGLSDFGLTPENCDSLLLCTHLNHILIEKIQCLDLEYIKTLIRTKQQTIETLHIYGGESVDDDCMFMLAQCPSLKDLSILRSDRLTDRGLDGIALFEPITHLQIWNNQVFTEEKINETLQQVNLRKLRRLSLSRIANVTGSIVDIVCEYYTSLTFMALYQCPKVVHSNYDKQLKAKFKNIVTVMC